MAKMRLGRKYLDSYTITGSNEIVRVGDCVLMHPSDTSDEPYVARVEKIEQDSRNIINVLVMWYYRPKEIVDGRLAFHRTMELFLSDHYDVQSVDTIDGKCSVHSFRDYVKLENVGTQDYYSRFEYNVANKIVKPDKVYVYCECSMPYNSDDLMVQCETCKDWFHPHCMGINDEQAKELDKFLCSKCK